MKRMMAKTEALITCQCGCNTKSVSSRMAWIQVQWDTERRMIDRRHVQAYQDECETFVQLDDLTRALYRASIWRRWKGRHRVRTLKIRLMERLHGRAIAEREASQAAFLIWAPDWLANIVIRRWARKAEEWRREAEELAPLTKNGEDKACPQSLPAERAGEAATSSSSRT